MRRVINSLADLKVIVNEWCGAEFLASNHDAAVAFVAADLSDKAHAAGLRYGSDWGPFLEDLPETYLWDTMEQAPASAAAEPCVYCDASIGNPAALTIPAVDDDEGWKRMACEHHPDCEWVRTRAHRLEQE